MWARLIVHPEVLEAVAWAEAGNRRQHALAEAEQDRATAERQRQQDAAQEKVGTTVGAILLPLKGHMPIRNCHLKPHIPDATLKAVVAAVGIRPEAAAAGPSSAEDGVRGVFDITVLGGATRGAGCRRDRTLLPQPVLVRGQAQVRADPRAV